MKDADLALQAVLARARTLWSMPTDHGAAIVHNILEDPELI